MKRKGKKPTDEQKEWIGFLNTYEGVKADFELYSKFVRKGGVIAFHDIIDTPLHRELFCRVDKFWNEIKDGKEHDEFIENSDWGGIGILWI
jgi:hypothetical protein